MSEQFSKYKDTSLKKRAVRKFVSSATALRIISESEKVSDQAFIRKSWRTWHCNQKLALITSGEHKGKYQSNRCENRFCFICSARKSAERFQQLEKPVSSYSVKYVLTLTTKNVPENELFSRVERMFKFFNNSKLSKTKEYKTTVFVRSFEITWNSKTNEFHPHFHFLILGNNENLIKKQCYNIIEHWKNYFPGESHDSAQDFKPLKSSIYELVKYLTKVVNYDQKALYTIYKVCENKRCFQVKGFKLDKIKKIVEEVITNDEIQGLLETSEIYDYDMSFNDWINMETGETLTGIEPLPNNFKNNLKVKEL